MAAAQLTERVSLANFKNMAMSEPNGALVKTSGGNGRWNATATSADFISGADGKRRGISCRVSQDFALCWMIGLVSAPRCQQQQKAIAERVDQQCLTYAAYVGYDRAFHVYESGKDCGRLGNVQIGDYIEIVLNSEKPPSIEYRVNGNLKYKSKTPIVFPLFPKICACAEGPLAEDLRWISDPTIQVTELQAHIAEVQIQVRNREEEKQDLNSSTEAKQAETQVQLAAIEQQMKEMKAGSDATVAVTKEIAELLAQADHATSEAYQAASEAQAGIAAVRASAEQLHKVLQAENEVFFAALEAEREAAAEKEAEVEAAQALAEQLRQELKAENDARLAALEEKAELQMQLEAERAAAAEKKAEIEALLASNEQQKKETKAGSDALIAVTKENAQLLVQLQVASEAASDAKVQVESLQGVVEEQKKEVLLRNEDVLALTKELKAKNEAHLAALEEKRELEKELEAEKEASRAVAEKQAGVEALHSAFEKLKKEMEAESEALLAVTKEKAELQVELQAEREASRAAAEKKAERSSFNSLQPPEAEEAASCAWADEKLGLEIGALRSRRQSQAFEKAIGELADENARLQVEKKQMHAEMQELRRLAWSDEARSGDWDFVGSSPAPSSAGGNTV